MRHGQCAIAARRRRRRQCAHDVDGSGSGVACVARRHLGERECQLTECVPSNMRRWLLGQQRERAGGVGVGLGHGVVDTVAIVECGVMHAQLERRRPPSLQAQVIVGVLLQARRCCDLLRTWCTWCTVQDMGASFTVLATRRSMANSATLMSGCSGVRVGDTARPCVMLPRRGGDTKHADDADDSNGRCTTSVP